MTLLSPYAPLWPWLGFVSQDYGVYLNLHGRGYQEEAARLIPHPMWTAVFNTPRGEPLPDVEIDLRDVDVRTLILECLSTHGHQYPWALGSIWSALTDEQAGRLTAEIVRRVGPNPKATAGDYPVVPGVLSTWAETVFLRNNGDPYKGYARNVILGLSLGKNACVVDHWGWRVGIHVGGSNGVIEYRSPEDVVWLKEVSEGPPNERDRKPKPNAFQGLGDEKFLDGMKLADRNVLRTGAILIEQITPATEVNTPA